MKDHPLEIKQRIVFIFATCLFSLFSVFAIFTRKDPSSNIVSDMIHWMGLWKQGVIWEVFKVVTLNSLLFLGEIYQNICQMYGDYRYECFY